MTQWFHDPFARGTVLGAHADTDTFLNLQVGEGLRFADAPRQLVVWDATLWDNWVEAFYGDGSPVEIIHQIDPGVSSQLPVIERGKEGTTALDMTDTTHTFRVQAVQTGFLVGLSANIGTITVTVGGIDVEEGDVIVGDGAWDGQRLRLGDYYLWVDSTGDLRINNGAPSGDTDGVVVGTQT